MYKMFYHSVYLRVILRFTLIGVKLIPVLAV